VPSTIAPPRMTRSCMGTSPRSGRCPGFGRGRCGDGLSERGQPGVPPSMPALVTACSRPRRAARPAR
jgi:hypothetical protein